MAYNKIVSDLITVIETPEFAKFAKANGLGNDDRREIAVTIASDPTIGTLIRETGGLRKLRVARHGGGKSGGYRVIYYYHDADIPIFLITGFSKTEMENLSKEARNAYHRILPKLVAVYKKDGE